MDTEINVQMEAKLFFQGGGKEVDWTSTTKDKIIDKDYFASLSVTYNSHNYKTPTKSESDNPEELLLEPSCIVFNWKHKYFPYTGQTSNMCSLNKVCSIRRGNISPLDSRWYQKQAYLSSLQWVTYLFLEIGTLPQLSLCPLALTCEKCLLSVWNEC